MALDHFLVENFPDPTVSGALARFHVTAKDASNVTETGYTGTVHFTSTDGSAVLPADYTFVGGDSGTHVFIGSLSTLGYHYIKAEDLSAGKSGRQRALVVSKSLGWGLDPYAITPYGASESGIVYVRKAQVVSTHEVDVMLSGNVADSGTFFVGDALNPATWQVQRLDTSAYLTVVGVTQVGGTTFRVLCLEEFGSILVTHRISTGSLLDSSGVLISDPKYADFTGVLDEDKISNTAKLAKRRVAARDLASAATPRDPFIGGTLQLAANGDYKTASGADLIRKLVLRRLVTTPGDFYHLPNYGIGLRVKEAMTSSSLNQLRAEIERQVLQEPEVEDARATLYLDANGVLTVNTLVRIRPTGTEVEVVYTPTDKSVVL